MIKTNKTLSLKAAMLAGAASFAFANAHAQPADDKAIEFDIDAQELGAALTEFGIQSGKEVYFVEADVNGKTTNGIEGQFTSDRAITLILADAGVPYTFDDNGTVLIGKEYVRDASLGEESAPQPFRVAQLDQEEDVRGVDSVGSDGDAKRVEDTIVVTGSSIRGVVPDSAPIISYSAEDIRLSGATTIERFLETLPQNANSLTTAAVDAFGVNGAEGDQFRGSGVNLRGLGIGTTLVLLNGRRLEPSNGRGFDTSFIPVDAIERVEILSDGASAIYGSDAIGGVMNIVLKDDMEGGDLSLSYGATTRGDSHDRFQADLSVGTNWGSGSGILSFGHSQQSPLKSTDREFAQDFDLNVDRRILNDLVRDEQRNSVAGYLTQNFTDRLQISANALYSKRDSERSTSDVFLGAERVNFSDLESEQLVLGTSLEYEVADDLFVDLYAGYSSGDFELVSRAASEFSDNPAFAALFTPGITSQADESLELSAKLDGKLIDLPPGGIRFSLGGGYIENEFKSDFVQGDTNISLFDGGRDSTFLFGELFVPVVSEQQAVPMVHRFELSAAVRYTDYSDFGDSTVQRYGVLWAPLDGLNFRATFAESFRAPALTSTISDRNGAQLIPLAAIGFPDNLSPDNSSVVLISTGVRPGLTPEFSDTYTFGFDFQPRFVQGLSVSTTYYNIDYTDRFGNPDPSGGLAALFEPEDFSSVFDLSPTLEDITAILSLVPPGSFQDIVGLLTDPTDPEEVASVVTVVLDNRSTNLAVSQVEGVDFSVSYDHNSPIGRLSYGANIAYIINSFQIASPDAQKVEVLDTVGQPTSLKGSAHLGLKNGAFSGRLSVNYTDDYSDVFQTPEQPIESWTTLNLGLSYDFSESSNSLLRNTVLSATVNNLFDEDPPFLNTSGVAGRGLLRPIGFDPVNANPIGRFITFGLRKSF